MVVLKSILHTKMWSYEEVKRNTYIIFIVSYNGKVRGSIELSDEGEVIRWIAAIKFLNNQK